MFLSRRAVSAAARAASRSRCLTPMRFYSEAAPAPSTADKTAKSSPAASSKWAKPKPAVKPAAAARSASTNSPAPEPPVTYEPTTITHQPSDASEPLDPSVIDWSRSFHGISTKPVSEKQFKALMAPLPVKDIEVKPDGVIYLPEIKYRRRLNETFGPMGWGLIPKGDPVVGNAMVTREYALIADGRFVSQAQGENPFFSNDQLPSAVEGCKSNALMRCCKDLGIGSELWDPHYVRWFKKTHMEEAWVEHSITKKKRTFWYRKGEVDVAYPYKLAK